MIIKITHKIGINCTTVSSHEGNIAPNIGDKIKCKNTDGHFEDCKIVDKIYDFREEIPSVEVIVE